MWMKVLVTGANGFIGRNFCATLKANFNDDALTLYEYDKSCHPEDLCKFCSDCDIVFHFAGVNRPQTDQLFFDGNVGFTNLLLEALNAAGNYCPIVFTSSIHVETKPESQYSISKRNAEESLIEYANAHHSELFIYRLPNVFGKWSRPNYNSAVATFCFNVAHNLDITVDDPEKTLKLVYIDDLVKEFFSILQEPSRNGHDGYYFEISKQYECSVGKLVLLIRSFKDRRSNLFEYGLAEDSFEKKLYSTYLSYTVPSLMYKLKSHKDHRGAFTELLKTKESGQFSINVIKPGMTKGQHWHNTKIEKFFVLAGDALIRLRQVGHESEGLGETIEYRINGDDGVVIDIIPGYTHSITNTSESTDLLVLIWSNELFDPQNPDTYYEIV